MPINLTTQDALPHTIYVDKANRPPPPAGLHLEETRQPQLIAIAVLTWLAAVVSVILRIFRRKVRNNPIWLDEWVIIASLPFATALVFSLAGYGVSKGLGRHLWVTAPESLYACAIVMLISQIAYPVAVILVIAIRCQPVYAFWAQLDTGKPVPLDSYNCHIPPKAFLVGNAIPTLVTDLLLLLLPLPSIWGLRLPRPKKIGIVAAFGIGLISVLIVSIVRLNFLAGHIFQDPDITWNSTQVILWSAAEANVGIMCVCLPLLLPVLSKLKRGQFFGAERRRSRGAGTTIQFRDRDIYRLRDETQHGARYAKVEGANSGGTSSEAHLFHIAEE
ncbi:hypothetical protein VFPPC_07426 [Pochonia chlamydosporia 170]|uniref:Rhodopsin domain-containing protein n=1 Tax=Pochonia chlamydosporia 170 TaxID=1380566 RepID=A0A179F9U2_METCM|nr:hypothetical protein VFPPC_07426 [Pochonia chlamydosporia 170]OAQ61843.1 hypothetical protein VFPPC_07426 [Pochonia chlamydosporia 170]